MTRRLHDGFELDRFIKDVAKHELTIVHLDGVHRHIEMREPGTSNRYYGLITWPGYLCFYGDMGEYVFSRTHDMFEFFRRRSKDKPFNISWDYWAEKVQAEDKNSGVRKFSPDLFRQAVRAATNERLYKMTLSEAKLFWQAVQDEVLNYADDNDWEAMRAFIEFRYDGESVFHDAWEHDCRELTYSFMWCCCAIEHAIDAFDGAGLKQVIEEAGK